MKRGKDLIPQDPEKRRLVIDDMRECCGERLRHVLVVEHTDEGIGVGCGNARIAAHPAHQLGCSVEAAAGRADRRMSRQLGFKGLPSITWLRGPGCVRTGSDKGEALDGNAYAELVGYSRHECLHVLHSRPRGRSSAEPVP